MSGESKQEKKAGQRADQAVGTLQGGQEAFLQDALFQAIRDMVAGMVADPLSFSPERVRGLKEQGAATIHEGSQNAFDQMMGRLAGSSPGLARGGAAQAGAADIASQRGAALGDLNTRIDMAAIQQMWPDIMNALQAGMGVLNPQYAWNRDISNAQLGAASTYSALAGIPSPAQQIGGGIGSLAGDIFGGWAGSGWATGSGA